MFNYFKISINAFKESVREPIYFLMLLAALVLIGIYPSAALFVFSEQLKLVVDSYWDFEDMHKAEERLQSGDFFGKVIVCMPK